MRCKSCDYRLWNLTSRQCPECGSPFKPSEFEFVINSVQFCCPHCRQPYFGTGPNGHLVPPAFNCTRCRRAVSMDEMVLLPTGGLEEEQTLVDDVPWLERKRHGAVRAWFAMIGRALVAPGRVVRALPANSSVAAAWWFATLTQTLAVGVGVAPLFLIGVGFGIAAATSAGGGGPAGGAAPVAAVFAGTVLVFLGALLIFLALWGLATHGLLRITGRTKAGMGRTYEALCYSSAANALTGIPLIGFYFGLPWWLVSAVLMVKESQSVGGLRAAFATLTFPLLIVLAVVGFYVTIIVGVVSGAGPFASIKHAWPVSDTEQVTEAVMAYAAQHQGRGPAHAVELAEGRLLATGQFILADSGTLERTVPVGATTLDAFTMLPKAEQGEVVKAAIATLPEGVVAHRLGDFVFTYHGSDLSQPPPGLWIVLALPLTSAAATKPATDSAPSAPAVAHTRTRRRHEVPVFAGTAGGKVETIARSDLPAKLAAQNALRAQNGLPPLPDPFTVVYPAPPPNAPSD